MNNDNNRKDHPDSLFTMRFSMETMATLDRIVSELVSKGAKSFTNDQVIAHALSSLQPSDIRELADNLNKEP